MIDLKKLKHEKAVRRFADWKEALGAPTDMTYDEFEKVVGDYADLSYMMFKVNGRTIETVAVETIHEAEFPGFDEAMVGFDDVEFGYTGMNEALDSMIFDDSDRYYTRDQLKAELGCTDADIDAHLKETGEAFEDEWCVPTADGKAYHVLSGGELYSIEIKTQDALDVLNTLMKAVEAKAYESGPVGIAKVFKDNMAGVAANLDAKAKEFSDKHQMPKKLSVI